MTSTCSATATALPKPIPAWLDFAMCVSLVGLVGVVRHARGAVPMSARSRADTGSPITRAQLERLIDEAIEALDLLDGDTDLEPTLGGSCNGNREACDLEGDDCELEPSIGSFQGVNQDDWGRVATPFQLAAMADAEQDESEREHSLGSLSNKTDQRGWAAGAGDDLEEEHDGREPDQDDEPSLGSIDNRTDQRGWATYADMGHDYEKDDCDLEDNGDREPSLGSVTALGNQEHWAQGRDVDDDRVAPLAKARVISLAEKRLDRQADASRKKLPTPDDPHDLPEVYGMGVEGDCMIPEIYSGSRVAASKSEPYVVGDLVVVWLRPEHVKPGAHRALIKRLAIAPPPWVKFPYRESPKSELKAMMSLAMNNPPGSSFLVPCTHVLAVHRVVGLIPVERADSPSARYELFGRPLSGPAAQLLQSKAAGPRTKAAAKRVAGSKAVRS